MIVSKCLPNEIILKPCRVDEQLRIYKDGLKDS